MGSMGTKEWRGRTASREVFLSRSIMWRSVASTNGMMELVNSIWSEQCMHELARSSQRAYDSNTLSPGPGRPHLLLIYRWYMHACSGGYAVMVIACTPIRHVADLSSSSGRLATRWHDWFNLARNQMEEATGSLLLPNLTRYKFFILDNFIHFNRKVWHIYFVRTLFFII